jgi:hypothetical protein
MIKFIKFVKGLLLKGESSDPTDNLEGSVWYNSTSDRFKGYAESAVREITTNDQSQTLSNKTIDADSNTITNIENADIKSGAAIDATKIADGSVTSTEFQYINTLSSNAQDQLNAKALASDLTTHTGASTGVHGVTGSVVGTTDTQSLSAKTLVEPIIDNFAEFNEEVTPATPAAGKVRIYPKSDKKIYKLDSTGTETEIGSGSGSGINYVTNPDAESNTNDWSTYADAAGALPVDGTGGSANVTWTRTTSTPLRGAASFLFSKDSVNRQGQGVSTPITIDVADQANILSIQCDYTLVSGTYVTGDLTAYIYDVTNGVVIQPAGFEIVSVAAGLPNKLVATFQSASNSTSYRLIIHCASVSALAYELKFDNFSVGPQSVSYGAPITNPEGYTLTVGAVTTPPTLGSVHTNKAVQWREGKYLHISYQLRTTSGGSAGAGIYLFPLPAGLSIDTEFLALDQTGALGGLGTVSADSVPGELIAWDSTRLAGVVAGAFISATNYNLASARYYSFSARVPILGWSSNVAMSDSADNRVIAAEVYRNANQSFSGGAYQDVIFDTITSDTVSKYNTSTGVYTISSPGYYDFEFASYCALDASAPSSLDARVRIDDSVSIDQWTANAGLLVGSRNVMVRLGKKSVYLVTGQTIKVQIASTSGGATIALGGRAFTHFSISKQSSNQTIAASAKISAIYETNAGQSIPNNSTTVILYEDKLEDTHGAYNISNGRFTAPIADTYKISAMVTLDNAGTWSASEQKTISIFKNGSLYRQKFHMPGINLTNAPLFTVSIDFSVYLLAEEYIDIRFYQDEGSTQYLSTAAYLQGLSISNK